MTKNIVVRSCYLLIMVWIGISLLPLLGLNGTMESLNSYDDDGCRKHTMSDRIICHADGDVENQYNPIWKNGDPVGEFREIATKSFLINTIYVWISQFIMIQLGALYCWNMHYKWFSAEIKSCWGDK